MHLLYQLSKALGYSSQHESQTVCMFIRWQFLPKLSLRIRGTELLSAKQRKDCVGLRCQASQSWRKVQHSSRTQAPKKVPALFEFRLFKTFFGCDGISCVFSDGFECLLCSGCEKNKTKEQPVVKRSTQCHFKVKSKAVKSYCRLSTVGPFWSN